MILEGTLPILEKYGAKIPRCHQVELLDFGEKHDDFLRIITDEMRQQIKAERTSYDQNEKLLSIILRRGPRAFSGLRMALKKANQTDLSKLLVPGNDTVSESDKKLAMARILVVNMTKTPDGGNNQRVTVQNNKSLKKSDVELVWMTSMIFS